MYSYVYDLNVYIRTRLRTRARAGVYKNERFIPRDKRSVFVVSYLQHCQESKVALIGIVINKCRQVRLSVPEVFFADPIEISMDIIRRDAFHFLRLAFVELLDFERTIEI